jgi:hypothetical protein
MSSATLRQLIEYGSITLQLFQDKKAMREICDLKVASAASITMTVGSKRVKDFGDFLRLLYCPLKFN